MLFQLSKSSSRCCLPVQSAQQLHDAKKHTMAQKDSSGSTHSVEEVAGEQHREDGDQQQAPVQGSSVQLHWQHGIIGAGLRQCLQHHWWFHCRDLHCVASKGTTKGWGLDGLDNKNLLLLSAGEKPKAGNGGKDEERRTTGHCDTRLGGFSLSLSAWSPKCSDLLKIDPWKCEICAAINICGTCIKKTFRHELTQLSIEQVNTQPSTPSADFLSLGKGQEGLKPCSVSLSCHLEKIPVIYGLTLSEQKREDPFPLHSILVRAPSTPWPTMLSLIPAKNDILNCKSTERLCHYGPLLMCLITQNALQLWRISKVHKQMGSESPLRFWAPFWSLTRITMQVRSLRHWYDDPLLPSRRHPG